MTGPSAPDWALLDRHRLEVMLLLDVPLESSSRARIFHRNGTKREVTIATRRVPARTLGIGSAAAALVLLAVAGMALRQRQPAPTPPPAAAALGLRAYPNGRILTVTWNRQAVRMAREGSISIQDGDHESRFALDDAQLAAGALTYHPVGREVSFRLQVWGPDGSRSETLRQVLPTDVAGASAQREPPQVATAPPGPQPAQSPASRRPVVHAKGMAAREAPQPRPSPFTPPTTGVADRVVAAPPEPPAVAIATDPKRIVPPLRSHPATLERDDGVAVAAETAPRSFLTRMVRRIPLVGRLKKDPKTYVPPKPLREVRPRLSIQEREQLNAVVPIDVRVRVAEDGRVETAELARGTTGARKLASAALASARQWTFVPAELNGEKAPGEVMLHFRFSPLPSENK